MRSDRTDTETLFDVVRGWAARFYPGAAVEEVSLRLNAGRKVKLPMPPPCADVAPTSSEPFAPNKLQQKWLAVLSGKALRADPLAAAAGCDRRRLFDHPGGLRELEDHGLVAKHSRLGYYRPDDPPEEISDTSDDAE